jgi:hypothetical protein
VLPLLYSAVTPPHSVTARRTAHRFFHAVPVNEGWSPTPVSRRVAERAHQRAMGPVPAEETGRIGLGRDGEDRGRAVGHMAHCRCAGKDRRIVWIGENFLRDSSLGFSGQCAWIFKSCSAQAPSQTPEQRGLSRTHFTSTGDTSPVVATVISSLERERDRVDGPAAELPGLFCR